MGLKTSKERCREIIFVVIEHFTMVTFFHEQVESFKANQRAEYALHSAFHMVTGDPVYRDDEYGHLQVSGHCVWLIKMCSVILIGMHRCSLLRCIINRPLYSLMTFTLIL